MPESANSVPPQNIEAEESVLGAMLVAEPALTRVIDEVKLNAADFYLDRHRLIFECAHDLYAQSKPVDELSVAEALTQRNKIEEAGGKHYVSELAAKVPAAGNAKHYAEIVQQNSLLRRLLGAGQEIQALAIDPKGRSPEELISAAQARVGGLVSSNPMSLAATSPTGVLETSQIDLLRVIHEGLPEREFIPGGEPWLLKGKRYLLPAAAGTGKSLLALIAGVAVVRAGGCVAILDVENGADEYARRLNDVLNAVGGPSSPTGEACAARLKYFEYPSLQVTWSHEAWVTALEGIDLVIFDSSRILLSGAGLAEDSNDEYSVFVSALLLPLSRAGITTLLLDNTGHEARDRARGASAKADLNEVVFAASVVKAFGHEQLGGLRLIRKRTRFSDLPKELYVPIGGGTYGPIGLGEGEVEHEKDGPPAHLRERISRVIENETGLSRKDALASVKGRKQSKQRALTLLIEEGFVCTEKGSGRTVRHRSIRPYRAQSDPENDGGSEEVPGRFLEPGRDGVPEVPPSYGGEPLNPNLPGTGVPDEEGPGLEFLPATEDEEAEEKRLIAKFGDGLAIPSDLTAIQGGSHE